MTIFEPMDVTMQRRGDGGENPNPRYDPQWSRIDAPRWRAGIIKARTGVEVRFNDQCTACGPEHSHENPTLIDANLNALGWTSVCSAFDSDGYISAGPGSRRGSGAALMTAIPACDSPACDCHDRLLPGQHRFACDPDRLLPLGKSALKDVDRLRGENKELAEFAYSLVLKSQAPRVENTALHGQLDSALAAEPIYQERGADLKTENASLRAQLATARNERDEASARASMTRMAP